MAHQSDLIASDIQAYLTQHESKELLRFLTCGNVDDGKSTLIGRLLHDSKMIYEDQIAALKKDSSRFGTTGDDFDPALLMDGLEAEREQGITIDVAYRYFSTTRRKFIIADTPGHEQYTRNMATGASTCDLAIILIDARHGVQTQTRRHSYIVSLIGIRHVIVAVNKMDLVGFDQGTFDQIRSDYLAFSEKLNIPDIRFIPISALKGDNVVNQSLEMPWFVEAPLMTLLDEIPLHHDQNFLNPRLPVQYINRPNLDFRGYSGTIAAGIFRPGDPVTSLPSGKTSRIASIVTADGLLDEAFAGQAVTFTLEDEIDISRGDLIIRTDDSPSLGRQFRAHLVWMAESDLTPTRPYLFKHNCQIISGTISKIRHRIDVNTQVHHPADILHLNEIAEVEVELNSAIAFDPYSTCKGTGSFIVIDRLSNATMAAGLIIDETISKQPTGPVDSRRREQRLGQRGCTIWLGQNQYHLLEDLENRLFNLGYLPYTLADQKQIQEASLVCKALNDASLIVLAAAPLEMKPLEENHLVLPEHLSVFDEIMAWMSDQGILLL